jgi:pimeloyl-ACP methyl ester carboxylesterase
VERPRLLLVPEFTELEWTIKPLLEEWAEVASYDSPGVGAESVSDADLERIAADGAQRRALIAERGLEEVSRRNWERFILVSDSGGNHAACRLASARPDAVQAMAFGHACLSLESEGERAPINAEVRSAMESLVGQDREQFVQHALTQLTGGSYDEALASRILERVPMKLLTRAWLQESDERADRLIRDLDFPLLFVRHEGCLMYTDEGFEDAAAAIPRAQTASVADKPSVSRQFAELLREFCEGIRST